MVLNNMVLNKLFTSEAFLKLNKTLKTQHLLVLLTPYFLFQGCSEGFKVNQQISASIAKNLSAKDYNEWEMSEDHPENIFTSLRKQAVSIKTDSAGSAGSADKSDANDEAPAQDIKALKSNSDLNILGDDICKSLVDLEKSELELFEGVIRDDRNQELLKGCLSVLNEKLLEGEIEHQKEVDGIKNYRNFKKNDSILTAGSHIPLQTVYRNINQGYKVVTADLEPKQIALTFDDGPDARASIKVANTLEEYGIKAHFFVIGDKVKSSSGEKTLKSIAGRGHSIGNHSMTHPCMGGRSACGSKGVSEYEAKQQIIGAHQAIFDVLGFVDPIFRFPYGASTPNLRSFLAQNSTAEFFWNIDSNDWRMNRSVETVLEDTFEQLDRQRRGVVLFHDMHMRTAIMLPEFLEGVAERGYTVVLIQPTDEVLKTKEHPLLKNSIP